MSAPSVIDRVKTSLVALKMPRALEVLDVTLRGIERGEIGGADHAEGPSAPTRRSSQRPPSPHFSVTQTLRKTTLSDCYRLVHRGPNKHRKPNVTRVGATLRHAHR